LFQIVISARKEEIERSRGKCIAAAETTTTTIV